MPAASWRGGSGENGTTPSITAPTPPPDGERRVYVNVSPEGLHAGRIMAEWFERDRLHPIFLLHDLIPITHPEYVREGHAARHAHRLGTMLKHGSSVLTNSASTALQLRRRAAG